MTVMIRPLNSGNTCQDPRHTEKRELSGRTMGQRIRDNLLLVYGIGLVLFATGMILSGIVV